MTFVTPGGLGQLKPAGGGGGAWDPATMSGAAGILSDNNRTITSTGTQGNPTWIAGVTRRSTGVRYFEVTIQSVGNQWTSVGVVSNAWTGSNQPIGLSVNSSGCVSDNQGVWTVYIGAGLGGQLATFYMAGDVIGVVVDFTVAPASAIKLDLSQNGVWSSTYDYTTYGPQFPWETLGWLVDLRPACSLFTQSGKLTLNTAGPFAYPIPAIAIPWG